MQQSAAKIVNYLILDGIDKFLGKCSLSGGKSSPLRVTGKFTFGGTLSSVHQVKSSKKSWHGYWITPRQCQDFESACYCSIYIPINLVFHSHNLFNHQSHLLIPENTLVFIFSSQDMLDRGVESKNSIMTPLSYRNLRSVGWIGNLKRPPWREKRPPYRCFPLRNLTSDHINS